MVVMKQRGAERYLPFWVSSSQAEILASQLQELPDNRTAPDTFLANNSAAESNIKSVTIYLKNDTFFAKVLLSKNDQPSQVRCLIGVTLALACRVFASILIEEELFDEVDVTLPPRPLIVVPKQPRWRRLFK